MRKIVVLLTLYAAGVATWWLVERSRPNTAQGPRVDPFAEADTRNEHVRQMMYEARSLMRAEIKNVLKNIDWRLSRIETVRKAMDEGLAATQRASEDAAQGSWSKVEALEEDLEAIGGLRKQLNALKGRLRKYDEQITDHDARLDQLAEELKKRPASSGPVAPSEPATPTDPKRPGLPIGPREDPDKVRAVVKKAREDLQKDDIDIVFPAIELLRKYRILQEVPRLLEILASHDVPFGRMAAAAALGEMKVCDAVPGLIEALLDKDNMVNQQANKSIRQITGHDSGLSADAGVRKRRAARTRLKEWWRDNEAEVRERLGQPKE